MRISIDFLRRIFYRENRELEAISVEQKEMSAETDSAENAEQKAKRTVQSGRSMVEMLGVLAVIGVLSVAGIAGYQFAMNKYRANQIANELNLAGTQIALALARPHQENFDLTLGSPYDEGTLSSGFAFTYGCGTDPQWIGCLPDDKTYYEAVAGLPEDLCKSVAQLTQNLPYLIEQKVNDSVDTMGISCDGDNNEIVMLFAVDEYNSDNSQPPENLPFIPATYSGECTTDADCDRTFSICYKGICIACLTDNDCQKKGQKYCKMSWCIDCETDEDCSGGEMCNTAGYCIPLKTCTQDSDCGLGLHCLNGKCSSNSCKTHSDCPEDAPFCSWPNNCTNNECNSNTDCIFIGKTTCAYDDQAGGNRCQ